ncbi:hypothetical protein SDRG_02998 [Saprolegnia diclina VS20]|uniref:EF-hand domain-containing protein n=1 Tax=Saprolegnia diclina (strain VS20) TaxID=1156394 RepID=T0S9W3_SAPDV|nr:hypothetical protein SDRG_02998 [Saprolegnia diclina VS20]EQC39562.1 hypothetical protein SDRG_02998 [Saprolegnia diclina VS20]|eukprot:XP_008606834.1 hypothetical protein SDRG_02998 [Saprolegnia diclina VS20]
MLRSTCKALSSRVLARAPTSYLQSSMAAAALLTAGTAMTALSEEAPTEAPKKKSKTRWHTRQKYEDGDKQAQLMNESLTRYKQDLAAFDSIETRFDVFAKAVNKDKKNSWQKVMTFTDFVHALVLPRFRTAEPPSTASYACDFTGDANGLISYEECHLLVHLLQIPVEHFDVAFHMFDLDGNGTVDKAEFLEVLSSVLNNIKDTRTDASKPKEVHVEASFRLLQHFFGKHGKKKITAKEFIAVIQSLKEHLLRAEFDLYATERNGVKSISVHDFAVTLISCLDPKHLPSLLPRLQLLAASDERVSWQEFVLFHSVIQNHLEGIKLAFELRPEDEVNEEDFIKAAYIVSGVRLPEHIMAMVFRVFDANGNGTLDEDELLKILATRNQAALHKTVPLSRPAKFWACLHDA